MMVAVQKLICGTWKTRGKFVWLAGLSELMELFHIRLKRSISRGRTPAQKFMFSASLRIQLELHRSHGPPCRGQRTYMTITEIGKWRDREVGHGFYLCFLTLIERSKASKVYWSNRVSCFYVYYTRNGWSDTPFCREHGSNGFVRQPVRCHAIWTNYVLLYMAEKQMSNISHGMRDHQRRIVRQRLVYYAPFDAPCLYPSQHAVPTSELMFRQGFPNWDDRH